MAHLILSPARCCGSTSGSRRCSGTGGRLIGRRFLPLVHPDSRESTWFGFQQLARGFTSTFQSETQMLHRGGGIVWELTTVNMIRDTEGQPKHMATVIVSPG